MDAKLEYEAEEEGMLYPHLINAAKEGDVERCCELIGKSCHMPLQCLSNPSERRTPLEVDGYANEGASALHQAVVNAHPQVVEALINAKANCNYDDATYSWTPLHTCLHPTEFKGTKCEMHEILKFLVEAKADAQQQDVFQDTPADWVQYYHSTDHFVTDLLS